MNIMRAGLLYPAIIIHNLNSNYYITVTLSSPANYEIYSFVPNYNGFVYGLGREIDATTFKPVKTD